MMTDKAIVMHKHVYIEGNYNPTGIDFLTKKSIDLTEDTKVVVAVFQEEENCYPPEEAEEAMETVETEEENGVLEGCFEGKMRMGKVTYFVHIWEIIDNDYHPYKGYKHLTFQSQVTTFNRNLIARVVLNDSLKETHPQYTHYELDIDIVIFERASHICNSSIVFA